VKIDTKEDAKKDAKREKLAKEATAKQEKEEKKEVLRIFLIQFSFPTIKILIFVVVNLLKS
jgi:hypothetical protein